MKQQLSRKEILSREATELINLVLPIPREVMSFYKKHALPSIGKGYAYIEYIAERKGKLLQRVFCLKSYGLNGRSATLREMSRRYENGYLVVSNVYGGYMNPYFADDRFTPEDMHESGWSPKLSAVCGRSKPSFSTPNLCVNKDKWLKRYPYCAYEQYTGTLNFWEYLCKYRKQPRIELLVKAGYSSLVSSYARLNIHGKNFKEIFKVTQPFAEEYLKTGSIRDIEILRNNPWIGTGYELDRYKGVKNSFAAAEFSLDEIKYAVKNDVNTITYRDYLNAARKNGYPLNQTQVHFPKDLEKAHDKAIRELKIMEAKFNDKAIGKLSEEYQKLAFEKDGYTIFPLSCSKDLILESEALHHCVRTYIDACAKQKSLILFVRKSDEKEKPFVTVELIKSANRTDSKFNKINQVRGINNSAPDKGTSDFLMKWKKHFRLTGWAAA